MNSPTFQEIGRLYNMFTVLTMLLLLSIPATNAQNPSWAISYQGELKTATGSPLPTDDYPMTFRIWSAMEGTETENVEKLFEHSFTDSSGKLVSVVNGRFSVTLGGADGLPLSVFDGAARYMEIEVAGNQISPRQLIVSSPYAHRALFADSARTADAAARATASTRAETASRADSSIRADSAARADHSATAGALTEGSKQIRNDGFDILRLTNIGDVTWEFGIVDPGIASPGFPSYSLSIGRVGKPGEGVAGGSHIPRFLIASDGTLFQRGRQIHADYVFEEDYELESIEVHSSYMWKHHHLPAIPPRTVTLQDSQTELLNLTAHNRGLTEELEKAHIYIEQLNSRLKSLEKRLQVLEETETQTKDPGHQ